MMSKSVLDIMVGHFGERRCLRSRRNSPRRAALYRMDDPNDFYVSAKGSTGAVEVFAGPKTKLTAFGWHVHKVTQVWSPDGVARDAGQCAAR